MPDPNMRLKALIHDAKMVCRHKLLLVKEEFPGRDAGLAEIIGKAKDVFRKFDQFEMWSVPVEFDEILIRQQILDLNRVEETDLPAFTESMESLLNSLNSLPMERARSRSIFDSSPSLNPKMEEALVKNQRLIDEISEKFRLNGTNLGEIPEYTEAENRQEELADNYLEKLRNNEVQANSGDLGIIGALYGGLFEKLSNNLPTAEKFIQRYGNYNDDIEKICPLTA